MTAAHHFFLLQLLHCEDLDEGLLLNSPVIVDFVFVGDVVDGIKGEKAHFCFLEGVDISEHVSPLMFSAELPLCLYEFEYLLILRFTASHNQLIY